MEAAGAPRDLGLAQGRVARAAIAERVARLGHRGRGLRWPGWRPWRGRSADPSRRLARDVARHQPHLAERTEGMSRGAQVRLLALFDALAAELRGPHGIPARPVSVADGGPKLSLALGGSTGRDWIVRRCAPEGGHVNLTVTRPWLAGGLAGVNEAGLAAVAWQVRAASAGERCHAPAFHLLEQCLERFSAVGNALDWCGARPVGGRVRIALVDAAGARGGMAIDGAARVAFDPAKEEVPPARGGDPAGVPADLGPGGVRVAVNAERRELVVAPSEGPELRLTLTGD